MSSVPLTLEGIRADVADVLGEAASDIPDDENLAELGMDSVRLMSLVERWRTGHGVKVSFVELAEKPGLLAWWDLLRERA